MSLKILCRPVPNPLHTTDKILHNGNETKISKFQVMAEQLAARDVQKIINTYLAYQERCQNQHELSNTIEVDENTEPMFQTSEEILNEHLMPLEEQIESKRAEIRQLDADINSYKDRKGKLKPSWRRGKLKLQSELSYLSSQKGKLSEKISTDEKILSKLIKDSFWV